MTDGSIGFRVRLDDHGGNTNTPKFDRNLWIGIDADLNGSIDAFIGVATPAQNVILGIYDAGTGANTSPNTTSIASLTPTYTYTSSAANYDYRAVNYLNDGGTLDDLTPRRDRTRTIMSVASYPSPTLLHSLLPNFPRFSTRPHHLTRTRRCVTCLAHPLRANSLNQDLGGINNKTANLGFNLDGTLVDSQSDPQRFRHKWFPRSAVNTAGL